MAGARSIISLKHPVATALLAMLLLVRCGALTDEAVAPGAVEGLVYNAETLEPVEGVEVTVAGLPARTAADGTFRIDSVPPGSQQMVAQRADYALWADYIDVLPGQTKQAEINLLPIGPIQIRIKRPFSGSLVDAGLTVTAEIRSEFSVTEFTAEVGGISAPFQYVPSDGDYDAVLSLETLDSPSDRILVARARDANGDSSRVAIPIRFDRRPILTVVTPTGDAVATPSLRVTATCTDDDPAGCAEVIVFSGQTLARAEGGSLDEDVSFAQFAGQARSVVIGGRDRGGQLDSVVRTVYVESSAGYTAVAEGGPGAIVDATDDRLLVVNSAGDADTVAIVDRASGARTVVYAPAAAGERVPAAGVGYSAAALTSRGAMFVVGPWTRESLHEWRDGSRAVRSPGVTSGSLVVHGDYAIWVTDTRRLWRRDLAAGTDVLLDTLTGAENDVAANGDVVWEGFRYRAGVTSPYGSGAGGSPVTDGETVVFARSNPTTIVMAGPGGESVVVTDLYYPTVHRASYQVAAGWVAFTREDLTLVRQAWVRSPAGVARQVSIFGDPSWLETMGPDGELVFMTNPAGTELGRRYRVPPGGTAVEVGGRFGLPKYINGQLHLMIGPTLFRVNGTGTAASGESASELAARLSPVNRRVPAALSG